MNKKLLIALGTVGVIVIAGVASAGIVAYNSCGYDAKTGNYLYDGNKVAAHGTMDSAMQPAATAYSSSSNTHLRYCEAYNT